LKIHEYQAKEILRSFGVPTPKGKVAETPEEAKEIAKELGGGLVVVKAQIHAGGRGKGGGVKLAKNPDEAFERASEILGMNLVTHQTGPEGKIVNKVLVEQGLNIEKELYAGIVLDRESGKPVVMASVEGGMEIEEVAAKTPEKILKEYVEVEQGLAPFQARKLAFGLGLSPEVAKKAIPFFIKLYKAFEATDASLAEINPLLVTKEGDVLALDAKMNFDDNALFRHKDILKYRDLTEEDKYELEASKFDLNFIKLDGNVGCMVNGAGLAMATMDIIKIAGEEPANFLDVGGGANAERVENAFRIILSDPSVKAVLINIFGGIVRCDMVAEGIVEAAKKVGVKVPVVIRLQGTNAERGAEILKESGLDFSVATELKEAAEKVASVVKG
jgi:succinyl-CoA synthetase beta subunit